LSASASSVAPTLGLTVLVGLTLTSQRVRGVIRLPSVLMKAKSHRYYYYTCNRSCKQGREACNSRILPKDKIERLVIDQIKQKVLDRQCLEELVRLVNEELDAGHVLVKDRLSAIDTEMDELRNRLSRLYDALETGKLTLDNLLLESRSCG
jgi:hypothetical protein